ncbi:MAG: hypothetical protein IKE57_07235 [Oscillospiraceae bacterium]|nr:hypothetical protein [Oscillospiraceae bacterium]
MSTSRFTVTSLLLLAIIISVIGFLFTVLLPELSDHSAVNDYFPIEGTNLGVRYSSLYPNGLYTGEKGTLRLEGDFGHDWGAAAEGDDLYLNEYRSTSLGLAFCDVVRVDLETYDKEVLFRNTILRGRCASGELVCLGDYLLPSIYPDSNSLCRIYAMSSPQLRPEGTGALVLFLDPKTGEVLYSIRDEDALEDSFDGRYLARTLEEVRG